MKKIIASEAFYRWVMLLLAVATLIVGALQL